VNASIAPFDQRIVQFQYGLTNIEYFVHYQSSKSAISKFQNIFQGNELDYFKLIIARILTNEELFIAPRDALNVTSELTQKKMSKLRAQKLLDLWCLSRYLYQHADNRLYLGPRSLLEFKETLLNRNMNHLKFCQLCEDAAPWVSFADLFLIVFVLTN